MKWLRSGAWFSGDRRYRYTLTRHWDDSKSRLAFVMLNPSTADEHILDPTVTRCVGYARAWGFGGLMVGNLFALRSTDPQALYKEEDPVGPENDQALVGIAKIVEKVVLAWGAHGVHQNRGAAVSDLLHQAVGPEKLVCLGFTKTGQPRHPLYLRGDLQPEPYEVL